MKLKRTKAAGKMTMKNINNWNFGIQIKESMDLLKDDMENNDTEVFLNKLNNTVEHVYKNNIKMERNVKKDPLW